MALQSKNIELRVYIDGVNVTERCTGVSGVSYQLNNPSYCTITLECPDFDFLITEEDLQKIDNARKTKTFNSLTFNNKFKNSFLPELAEKTYGSIAKGEAGGTGEVKPKFLYKFGLFNHVVPVRANVRVFVKVNGIWYYVFTGVVNGRSFTVDENGRYFVTYQVIDVFWFLKRSTQSTSLGIYEPANLVEFFKNYIKIVSRKTNNEDKDLIRVVNDTDGIFAIPNINYSITRFGIKEREFIPALIYTVYGDVPLDISSYGDETESIKIGENIIERNTNSSGLWSLHQIEVGVFGQGAENFRSTLDTLYSGRGWRGKIRTIQDLSVWDDIVGNVVRREDVRDLAVVENEPVPGESTSMDEVVDIIGKGTRNTGLYPAGGQGLKILMPGSLTSEIYNKLIPSDIKSESLEFHNFQTRLQAFSWIVQRRTDMFFYSSPKGHLVVELPMYDVDHYGRDGWRIFTRNDWSGSFSDNENLDGLFSVARATPQVGADDLSIAGNPAVVDIIPEAQGAISEELVHKIGVRYLDNDVGFGYIPNDSRAAEIKARIILSLANRKSYTGNVSLIFDPRIMLNRQVQFKELGRAGLVTSQSTNLIPENAPSVDVNLGYMRQKGANGKFSIAFGTELKDLSIEYDRFFNPEVFDKPKEES